MLIAVAPAGDRSIARVAPPLDRPTLAVVSAWLVESRRPERPALECAEHRCHDCGREVSLGASFHDPAAPRVWIFGGELDCVYRPVAVRTVGGDNQRRSK